MKFYRRIALLFSSILLISSSVAQQWHKGEILEAFDQLKVVGSVLYIAAHPDDENTRLISYMAKEEKLQTAYLSLTRGDGGQNLIGSELREQLGMIRSQELMMARKTDGGRQFFTRANDFGYSKHPDETFQKWGKEQILHDVVYIIRYFKPDVIITRFNETPGTTHGHHTASAMLAREAFHLAADKKAFPEQLERLEVWQPKRLYWNTSSWFFSRNNQFKEEDFSKIDVGAYNTNLGKSYPEIAAQARSMHRSQAFGTGLSRGETFEYLEQWEGEKADNPLDGLDLSWKRVKGAKDIPDLIEKAKQAFENNQISESTTFLFTLLEQMNQLKDHHWRKIKSREVQELIAQINGIYLEAYTNEAIWPQASRQTIAFEATLRQNTNWRLERVEIAKIGKDTLIQQNLDYNTSYKWSQSIKVPKDLPISQPYWLVNKPEVDGVYQLDSNNDLEIAVNEPALLVNFHLTHKDKKLVFEKPILHKEVDYVKGEINNPLLIAPPVVILPVTDQLLFANGKAKDLLVEIKALENVEGEFGFKASKDWTIQIPNTAINLKKGESIILPITILANANVTERTKIEFFVLPKDSNEPLKHQLYQLDYEHIPRMLYMPKAEVDLIPFEFEKGINKIAYLSGAGDKVAESLSLVGYQVDILNPLEINPRLLAIYDAVILGVRYYNTAENTVATNKILFDYVQNGGTLVAQYNTSYGLKNNQLAPYDLQLGRGRVTDEYSKVTILKPQHPMFNYPNKIVAADFQNWVQERGLYFPASWDPNHFETLLSMADTGEEELAGSLITAQFGKGYFVYTGLSFFRQLPAGVPGAYRLFANILNLGKN